MKSYRFVVVSRYPANRANSSLITKINPSAFYRSCPKFVVVNVYWTRTYCLRANRFDGKWNSTYQYVHGIYVAKCQRNGCTVTKLCGTFNASLNAIYLTVKQRFASHKRLAPIYVLLTKYKLLHLPGTISYTYSKRNIAIHRNRYQDASIRVQQTIVTSYSPLSDRSDNVDISRH